MNSDKSNSDLSRENANTVVAVAVADQANINSMRDAHGVFFTKKETFGTIKLNVQYTAKSDNKLFGDEAFSYEFVQGQDWTPNLDILLKYI
jgi:hypothetical protein